MTREEMLREVAPCGMHCGDCPPYKARDDAAMFEMLVSHGYKKEFLPCPGCREVEGHCPHFQEVCATYKCVVEHGVELCFECPDFPCVKLHPAADRAERLPHNMKMYNLCTIRRIGLEAWREMAIEIKQRYYQGKITFGDGPQV
jgi:hypothetical protein